MRRLVCAVIIITPKSPIPMQCKLLRMRHETSSALVEPSPAKIQFVQKICSEFFFVTAWRDVECMVHHERVVGKELHPYISGANTK